jgi:hypothetical protein
VDPSTPQQHRLGDRRQVDEVAHLAILVVQQKRKPAEEALVPVMVRDASITGACLVLPFDAAEPPVGQTLTLVIDGERGSVRVRWSRRVDDPALGQTATCGVEFIDPHPTFLPSIYVWLDRQKALGGAKMRE